MSILDAGLIAVICALLGCLVTSVVWSHAAFMRFTEVSERIAILETKLDIIVARHEISCANFKPRGQTPG